MPLRMPRRAGLLLKTDQTTQYSAEEDDGYHEKGLDKRYEVLSTGQYAGTSNIDLVHLTDTSISFDSATKEIRDSNNNLARFKDGEILVVTGSTSNDGTYTVAAGGGNTAATCTVEEALTDEAAGASVSIAKREALSNNCVLDKNTGRMWARYTSAENAVMGTGGDGKMPWTGELYDIFQYEKAANAASLGGYSDWRVPNATELPSLQNWNNAGAVPDTTAFPSWPADVVWNSTTRQDNTAQAMAVRFTDGVHLDLAKTAAHFCALIRGG